MSSSASIKEGDPLLPGADRLDPGAWRGVAVHPGGALSGAGRWRHGRAAGRCTTPQTHDAADTAGQTPEYLEWVGLLKSCTAFEAYCRVYTADLRPDRIAEFLLLDPAFPHSVRFSVEMVQAALRTISDATGRRPGDRVNRLAGRLEATLRYGHIEEIMAGGLHDFLGDVAHQGIGVHDALYETYISLPDRSAP